MTISLLIFLVATSLGMQLLLVSTEPHVLIFSPISHFQSQTVQEFQVLEQL